MGWRKFCETTSNPYGKHYRAAFRKTIFPSQIPLLFDKQPKRTIKEMSNHVMERLFIPPEESADYTFTVSIGNMDPQFTHQEISTVIKHLPAGKAPGYDGIDNLVLKTIHQRFNPSFQHCSTNVWRFATSRFLKIGNIIISENRISLITSHRPISLFLQWKGSGKHIP
ncbi:hypothetical protein AVEN_14907-1 [Araneus ventricosus]|uniref:Reverse transcriptase domain-containing protein n=1 Tax=Araneus ventricosus TaxID=182803 RepID=A0A4Y2M6X0_ARAVE|nr:hypothetical protein AVEN_14907-1 [Araneus ventricosus]